MDTSSTRSSASASGGAVSASTGASASSPDAESSPPLVWSPDAAAAERAVLDWITETYFDPAYGTTPPPAPNLVDSIAGSVTDLFDTLMPGESFKLKSRRESDLRQIDAVLNRTTVRRRDLVFQASLGHELYARRVDGNGAERPDWPALRDRMNTDVEHQPLDLFDHVFANPTAQLTEQRAQVAAELAASAENDQEAAR